MALEVLAEEEVVPERPALRLVAPPAVDVLEQFDEPSGFSKPQEPRKPIDAQVLEVMGTLAKVLAVRMMLLLAVLGTFVLALLAMADPTPTKLVLVVLWAVASVAPLTWLASRRM